TLYVGYYDAPEQVMVAQILSVFIDERTGTTVKMTRFGSRDEAFEAIRNDKVSLYADYSGVVLARFGGEPPGPDPEKNFARLKELLNAKHNVIWLEPFGFDGNLAGGPSKPAADRGTAGLMLCKDALSKFPALPKLLGKLRGVLDNGTMAGLLREAKDGDPRAVARRFLKSRKLI
ncbi:MAG: glycine betaine ABC transporter substrate-binding protein, partial [Deltaproteobacteria bacterium]